MGIEDSMLNEEDVTPDYEGVEEDPPEEELEAGDDDGNDIRE